MAKFEKGNELWKKNPKFKENIGNITKEKRNSKEFIEKRNAGLQRYKALNSLKKKKHSFLVLNNQNQSVSL